MIVPNPNGYIINFVTNKSREMINTERIDLHMPKDWNAMTVAELETVSSVLISAAAKGHVDMESVKVTLSRHASALRLWHPTCPGGASFPHFCA